MSEHQEQALYPGAELFLLQRFMQSQKVSGDWLLGTGITAADFADTDIRLSNHQFDIVHRNIARLLGRHADAGLRLGSALNLSRWGMMAGALMCSRTLGEALATANRFRVLVRSRFLLRASVEDGLCVIRVTPVTNDLPVNLRFSLEVMVASLQTQIRQLLGLDFCFQSIELPVPEVAPTSRAADWQKHLNCPVLFSRAQTRLIFPAQWLESPLPLANPVARAQILRACDAEVQRLARLREGDMQWRLRDWLSRQHGRPSMAVAAAQLAVSERTLRRQLHLSGSSYTELLEEHCLQLAIQRLQVPGARVATVAAECGYRDSASFRAAFRRYTGASPRDYRSSLRTD